MLCHSVQRVSSQRFNRKQQWYNALLIQYWCASNTCRRRKLKQRLETNKLSFDEILSDLGYMNSESIRKIFVRWAGLLPFPYRNGSVPIAAVGAVKNAGAKQHRPAGMAQPADRCRCIVCLTRVDG